MSETSTPGAGGVAATKAAVRGTLGLLADWVILGANRRVIAGLLVVVVYAAMVVLGLLWPFEIQRVLTEQATVGRLLNTLLGGDVLIVSIVASINSLVLSEELVGIGTQHDRTTDSRAFREEVAAAIDASASPARPAEFLWTLLDAIETENETLAERAEYHDIGEDGFVSFVADVRSYTSRTRSVVGGEGELGALDMRLFGPRYDPVEELEAARQLRATREEMPDDVADRVSTLVDTLEHFTTAREYFKTMFYKREYARLSRDLLYTGIPTVVIVSYVVLTLGAAGTVTPDTVFGLDERYLFFTSAYVLALSPFLFLASYVVRATVVAENTITAGGFVVE